MDRPRVGALQAVRGRMRVVGGTTKSREEDEGKSDISLCPIERKMRIFFLEWNHFSGILRNDDLSMVFFLK